MLILGRRSAFSIALTLCFVGALVRQRSILAATTVEVYPGPGVNTYRSTLYSVEVFDGSNWIPAYVYGFTRLSQCHWHYGTYPTANFLTLGTTGPVNVRATRIGGSITSIDVSPHSKNIPVTLTGGQAVLTLNQNSKAWITVNGDDANPLFIFADAPKPSIPPGATYFGPGIVTLPAPSHYKPTNNEVIYLDGGAWVRGNIDITGTRNVRIMGPGVLSGDLWKGEDLLTLPYDQQILYSGIKGDSAGDAATVSGITILDTPSNGIWGGANHVNGVKLITPWFYGTDAFPFVSHIDHTFCFGGDEVFMPAYAGYQGENMTVTSCFAGTSNNTVFAGGWWGFESRPGYSTLVDDIDIKTYNNDDWVPPAPLLASALQVWLDNSNPSVGYSNQTYQNIRIEGNLPGPLLSLKNTVYPFGGLYAVNPPLGNSYNLVFRNIALEGTQKYHSEVLGLDANNGFHNLIFDNISMNGHAVTNTNYGDYFYVNEYVWGGVLTAPGEVCVANARTLCLSGGRFRVRASYDTDTTFGEGNGVALTSDTGYFWFFSPTNVEMVVKVLNGCGVNQNYWVFAGGLTNVGVTLTVTDTQTGLTRSYRNNRGTAFLPFQQTSDYGVCTAGSVIANEAVSSDALSARHAAFGGVRPGAKGSVSPELAAADSAACVPDVTTLCLNNGRFQVRASYDSDAGSGDGNGVVLTSDTGYFWFFSSTNVEIIVKVLNACPINQNFWVFAGGLTNVGVNLTVTDTQTGVTHTYRNVRGTAFLPLQKTGDFSVCP